MQGHNKNERPVRPRLKSKSCARENSSNKKLFTEM